MVGRGTVVRLSALEKSGIIFDPASHKGLINIYDVMTFVALEKRMQ